VDRRTVAGQPVQSPSGLPEDRERRETEREREHERHRDKQTETEIETVIGRKKEQETK
jgi:hypothetical protein